MSETSLKACYWSVIGELDAEKMVIQRDINEAMEAVKVAPKGQGRAARTRLSHLRDHRRNLTIALAVLQTRYAKL